ncbi:YcnI family protein [Curvibacter sp. CHRR-16]|uniref:YcnI family copper-binding membrane protein n=1 Tax=Curvibacter sp. CHRR-16 TaxID=2835872 RepID=UPI001BDB28A5|nr:YcnI family protein [Curvibacter sp. CHRR-16]MBT0569828.1 YcnI family protein [Curvibacter sp. CHRR-16]
MTSFAIKTIAACALLVGSGTAFSHVTLQDQAAAAQSGYRAVLRVGHGCAGAATTSIKVLVPAGFSGSQPMVKPGWKVTTVVGPLAEPVQMHGKTITDGVQEITWAVKDPADALPDALYDEFVLRTTTPKKPGTYWFKVVQTCTQGSNEWVQIPAAGQDAHSLPMPAARLDVLDVQPAGHHH